MVAQVSQRSSSSSHSHRHKSGHRSSVKSKSKKQSTSTFPSHHMPNNNPPIPEGDAKPESTAASSNVEEIREEKQQLKQDPENQEQAAPKSNNSKEVDKDEVARPSADGNNDVDEEDELLVPLPWTAMEPITSVLGITGLLNVGNTCYLNSVLQCLSNCSPLTAYFNEGWPGATPPTHAISHKERHLFVEHFAHLMHLLWCGKYRDIRAIQVTKDVINAVPEFQHGGQQDAQEALNYILNHIHDDLFKVVPAEHHPARRSILRFQERQRLMREQAAATKKARMLLESDGADSLTSTKSTSSGRKSGKTSKKLRNPRTPASSAAAASQQKSTTSKPASTAAALVVEEEEEEEVKHEPLRQATSVYQQSIINDTMLTYLAQRIKCRSCGNQSVCLEEYLELSLALPSKGQLKEMRRVSVDSGDGGRFSHAHSSTFDASANANGTGQPHEGGGGNSFANVLKAGLGHSTSKGPSTMWGSLKTMVGLNPHSLSLDDCLRAFFAPEKLEGNDQYYCDQCERKEDAVKTYSLMHLPEVVSIHLKRFNKTSGWGLGNAKNGTVVNFPLAHLDLGPYMYDTDADHVASNSPGGENNKNQNKKSKQQHVMQKPDDGGTLYDLCGVVKHTGGINSGHYIAVCKNQVDNRWYEYDDELVNVMKEDQVLNGEAYLLFYEKRAHTPQLVRKEKIERALMRSSALQAERKAQITHYVSFYWTIKWATMSNPGSVSNRYATCEHDLLVWPEGENPALRLVGVTEEMWNLVKEEYGAGDALNTFKRCEECHARAAALHERRQHEYREYQRTEQVKTTGLYIIHTHWLHKWREFVLNEDMHNGRGTWEGVLPPGPITNDLLFEKPKKGEKKGKLVLKKNLRKVTMYRGVNAAMWKFFVDTYGIQGEEIRRSTLDIYGEEPPLGDEMDLLEGDVSTSATSSD